MTLLLKVIGQFFSVGFLGNKQEDAPGRSKLYQTPSEPVPFTRSRMENLHNLCYVFICLRGNKTTNHDWCHRRRQRLGIIFSTCMGLPSYFWGFLKYIKYSLIVSLKLTIPLKHLAHQLPLVCSFLICMPKQSVMAVIYLFLSSPGKYFSGACPLAVKHNLYVSTLTIKTPTFKGAYHSETLIITMKSCRYG